ncbi:MAG TPA: hypothetical protein VGO47_02720 [Chlamydiales bacterium]|nr:hypothetical protein [Chlamydiales bacterium]
MTAVRPFSSSFHADNSQRFKLESRLLPTTNTMNSPSTEFNSLSPATRKWVQDTVAALGPPNTVDQYIAWAKEEYGSVDAVRAMLEPYTIPLTYDSNMLIGVRFFACCSAYDVTKLLSKAKPSARDKVTYYPLERGAQVRAWGSQSMYALQYVYFDFVDAQNKEINKPQVTAIRALTGFLPGASISSIGESSEEPGSNDPTVCPTFGTYLVPEGTILSIRQESGLETIITMPIYVSGSRVRHHPNQPVIAVP